MKIAPVAFRPELVKFCTTNYNLTLAHLFEDDDYYKFWRENRTFKILDNGAAEGAEVDPKDLVELAVMGRHREVVAPDVLGKSRTTLSMTKQFVTTYADTLRHNNIGIMGVPQGETFEEFRDCLWDMLSDNRITSIGFNKRMDQIPPFNSRLGWLYALQHMLSPAVRRSRRYHLLGVSRIVGEPYFVSRDLTWIRGMDSTYPITAGLNSHRIQSIWEERLTLSPNAEYTREGDHCVRYNIEQLASWGNYGARA